MTTASLLPPYLALKFTAGLGGHDTFTLLFELVSFFCHPCIREGMFTSSRRTVSNILRQILGIFEDCCFRELRERSNRVISELPKMRGKNEIKGQVNSSQLIFTRVETRKKDDALVYNWRRQR